MKNNTNGDGNNENKTKCFCCGGLDFKRKGCGKFFSDKHGLDGVRTEDATVELVVELLCEGSGIRSIARVAKVSQNTVLRILESAGAKAEQLMATKLQGYRPELVEIDEVYGFVGCLQQNTKLHDGNRGEQYAFLATDAVKKLVLQVHVGKRDGENTGAFLQCLKLRCGDGFQITSDGFDQYKNNYSNGVLATFGDAIDYGTEIKTYGRPPCVDGWIPTKDRPVVCKSVRRRSHIGSPDMAHCTVNHAEMMNLSVRLFNRRFTRKTLGYSKKIANHRYAIILQAAHFNFCRVHSSIDSTPAVAAGLTDHTWTVKELLTA